MHKSRVQGAHLTGFLVKLGLFDQKFCLPDIFGVVATFIYGHVTLQWQIRGITPDVVL